MPLVPLAPIARAPVIGNVTPVQLTSNANRTAQMGQAIQQAGETLVNLQAKYAELVDARSMIAAENVMRQTTNDFNAWRLDPQNADESAWLPKWQEMQAAAQKQLDGLKMTEGARLNTTRSWGRWSDAQTISVQGDVFKQGVQRTKDAIDLRVMQATKEGDDERIRSSYQHAATLGVMTPERAALEEYEALQKSKQVRVSRFNESLDAMLNDPAAKPDDVRAFIRQNPDLRDSEKSKLLMQVENRFKDAELEHLIDTNPVHGLEIAKEDLDRERITANRFDELKRRSEAVQTRERGKQYAGIADAMKAKSSKAEIMKLLDEGNFLTPGDKAEILTVINTKVDDEFMLSTLAKEAANFQHPPDSPEYFLFTKRVDAMATGNNRSHILGLRDKALAGEKDGGSFSRSFGKVFAFADDDLKNGVFGPTTSTLDDPKAMLPPKMRAEVDAFKKNLTKETGMMWDRRPKTEDALEMEARALWLYEENKGKTNAVPMDKFVFEDEAKIRVANALRVQAMQELEAFQKANPNKLPSEAVAQYDSITAKLRSDKKLPPIAPRGGVNPAGTTLPNVNERANSIFSR